MLNDNQDIIDLSVVIITKDEEEMIGECIESIIASIEYAVKNRTIDSYEIILADSASTDQTIEIAEKYPLKIVQLNKKWPLSAPAGRYIGWLHSKGKYVFFMDGDCILNKEWINISIPHLKDETVAGVDGIEEEHIDVTSPFYNLFKLNETKIDDVIEAEELGKAIFKRDALNKVGSYHPYLIGAEDRDISYRMRDAGYKLLRLPYPYVTHHWAKKDGKLTLKTFLKSVYVWSKGEGEALRYSFKNKRISKQYLLRYVNTNYIKIYGAMALFISLIYMNILTFLLMPHLSIHLIFTVGIDSFLFGLGLMYAGIRYYGGKWNEFIFSFHLIPYVLIRHFAFVLGFLKKLKSPDEYPTDVKIIK